MSSHEQNECLTENQSPKGPDPLQTGYEFYQEKYFNFVKHIKNITTYYPGLNTWYHRLEGVDFAVFIQIVGPQIEDKTPRQILEKFALDEDFQLDSIKDADLDKIERYIQLFQVMLEEEV
jgi:hypothetical protein